MTLSTCAETLRDYDPDRFGMFMAAAPADRPKLATLYALNLELARAPLQSAEPMLAEMRLQWWVDRLDEMGQGVAPPQHHVLTPLWDAWGQGAGALVPLAEARRNDSAREPHADRDAVIAYVDDTAGALMTLAAGALGAGRDLRGLIADQGRGAGLTAWLRGLPALHQMGMALPLRDAAQAHSLATEAQAAFRRAAAARRKVGRSIAPALFAGTGAGRFLATLTAGADPYEPAAGPSPFARRAALARLALTGRWWV